MHHFIPAPPLSSLSNHQEGDGTDPHLKNLVAQNMERFWIERREEILNAPDARRSHPLPLACIKRIMKSNEQVKMVSADTPVVFAKACEIFIMELTLRAWVHARNNKRRTLRRDDLVAAVRDEGLLDFLADFVPLQLHPDIMQAGYSVATDPRLVYEMNVHNMNHAFFTGNQEVQRGLTFQLPPPSSDETNPQRGLTLPLPPPSSDETNPYRVLK